jgi:hypothetical protein
MLSGVVEPLRLKSALCQHAARGISNIALSGCASFAPVAPVSTSFKVRVENVLEPEIYSHMRLELSRRGVSV